MTEANESAVKSPSPGDVWEFRGEPEMLILSVGKGTIEYTDKKLRSGPGIWEWDLVQFQTMSKSSLKRYVCNSVPGEEQPEEYLYDIGSFKLPLLAEEFHRKMNRHLDDREVPQEVEVGEYKLRFTRNNKATLVKGKDSIEIPLSVLFALSEEVYERLEL